MPKAGPAPKADELGRDVRKRIIACAESRNMPLSNVELGASIILLR